MQVLNCPMTDFKTQSAGYLANHMARLFEKGLYRRIQPLGLAPAQFMTLLVLWEQDGITQQNLRLQLDVEQATMANTLKRMERDGLITRRAHKSDKRARLVYLTDKAREMRGGALEAAKAQNELALADLSEQERDLFVSMMRRVVGRMKDG